MNIKNNPLVSIIVITYNSSRYVLETLESVKSQTYRNLELIVSDDCSLDNTVEICIEWLDKNKWRFVNSNILTSLVNTGITANCNRGLNAANGEWVKFLAGDDALYTNSIEILIKKTCENSNIKILQSDIDHYSEYFNENSFIKTRSLKNKKFANENISAHKQYKILLCGNYVNAPGTIISRDILIECNGFDNDYPIEDYPLWLKLTKRGYKIYYLNKSTVMYRVHKNSITTEREEKKLFNNQYRKLRKFYKNEILPNVNIFRKMSINYNYYIHFYLDKFGLNINNLPLKILYLILLLKIDFIFYKIINKNGK